MYSINLGAICNKMNDPDGPEEHLKYAESCFNEGSEYLPKLKAVFLQTDLLYKRYDRVVENGLQLLRSDYVAARPDISSPASYLVASAYFHLGEMAKAADILSAMLGANSDLETKIEVYNLMAEIRCRQHDYQSALACKDMAHGLYVTSYRSDNKPEKLR